MNPVVSAFVLDCSMTIAWCFEDESTPRTDAIQDSLATGTKAYVPSLWLLEISNALLVAERRQRITRTDVGRYLSVIRMLPVEIIETAAHQVFNDVVTLAREHRLSSYDAAYLELAIRKGVPLATLDQAVIAAAMALKIHCL